MQYSETKNIGSLTASLCIAIHPLYTFLSLSLSRHFQEKMTILCLRGTDQRINVRIHLDCVHCASELRCVMKVDELRKGDNCVSRRELVTGFKFG